MNQAPEHINVTLRLPRDLHQWLKKSADENRHSMSAHTLYLLDQSRQQNQQQTKESAQ